MKDIRSILLSPSATIREAISVLDEQSLGIVLVVDEAEHFLGTITDGDIRRSILRGDSLDAAVSDVMNKNPVVGQVGDEKQHLLNVMLKQVLRHLPILDSAGKLSGIETLEGLVQSDELDNWVIIMAGGRGKRLRPLTDTVPKPMVPVAGRPMLEIIIDRLAEQGFRKFIISLNYKGHLISDHFGDGSSRGVKIKYISEDQPLGTAGALYMIDEEISEPFLVMNGDVLTEVNCRNLLDYHAAHPCAATMCVREHQYEVPFGVVEIDGHRIVEIVEKPTTRYLVNAGIYLVDPKVLGYIEKNTYLDMPMLFDRLRSEGQTTHVFPILEAWRDVGRPEDLSLAIEENS